MFFFERSKNNFDLLCKMQAPHRTQIKAIQGGPSSNHEQGNPKNGKAPQNRLWRKKQVPSNREKTEQKSGFYRGMRCLQAKKGLFVRQPDEKTGIGLKRPSANRQFFPAIPWFLMNRFGTEQQAKEMLRGHLYRFLLLSKRLKGAPL